MIKLQEQSVRWQFLCLKKMLNKRDPLRRSGRRATPVTPRASRVGAAREGHQAVEPGLDGRWWRRGRGISVPPSWGPRRQRTATRPHDAWRRCRAGTQQQQRRTATRPRSRNITRSVERLAATRDRWANASCVTEIHVGHYVPPFTKVLGRPCKWPPPGANLTSPYIGWHAGVLLNT